MRGDQQQPTSEVTRKSIEHRNQSQNWTQPTHLIWVPHRVMSGYVQVEELKSDK